MGATATLGLLALGAAADASPVAEAGAAEPRTVHSLAEPGTLALLGLGLVGLALIFRGRRD
jgi:hypothetical protein